MLLTYRRKLLVTSPENRGHTSASITFVVSKARATYPYFFSGFAGGVLP